MKKLMILVGVLMIVGLLSVVSAETVIMLDQQPKAVYSLGDKLSIPVTISSSQGVFDFLEVSLICDSRTHVFPADSIDLMPGEAKNIDASVLLISRFIGGAVGTCKIRAGLENEVENYVMSNEFRISNLINLDVSPDKASYRPGDSVVLSGEAMKENGESAGGIFELTITENAVDLTTQGGVVNNGRISTEIPLNNDTKAGIYMVSLNVRETDPLGQVTNTGSSVFEYTVDQVARNLEIVFENEVVEPGTDLRVKGIMRDQTGENIESTTAVKVKNKDGRIVGQGEVQTDEFFSLPVVYNEVPGEWTVVFESGEIENEMNFSIGEKSEIGIEILDRTLILTNMGNVPYNDTATVKVGEETLFIDVALEVDEEKRYRLEAPDGEYTVEVAAGENLMTGSVMLTGKSVDVSEASGSGFVKYSFVWLFIILVLGFVFVIAYKRGYQRTFVGYVTSRIHSSRFGRKKGASAAVELEKPLPAGASPASKVEGEKTTNSAFKDSVVSPKSKAELSLSMQGNKQDVCIVVLNVKNVGEVDFDKGNAKETLQRIVDVSDENKASTYQGKSSLFFILAPERTKTFDNAKAALEVAKQAKEILADHNKKFQQKLSFGISIDSGPMIVKSEGENLQFMSLGNLMTNSKKISTFAEDDVLLSEKITDKLRSSVKTERSEKNGIPVYSIKEIKKNPEGNKGFLKNFVEKNFENGEMKTDKKEEGKSDN